MGIIISGTGSYAPEKVLTNEDLEKMVETSDEWITTRTGIKERHIADDNTPTSDLAKKAAENALEAAGIGPRELSAIIVATVTHDQIFPSTACLLQKKLDAGTCACVDIQAACSGLLYGIEMADSLLRTKKNYKHILVVGAEKLSYMVDWEDRSTCVLFGDGAGAIVLSKNDEADDFVLETNLGADGRHDAILNVPAGGSLMPASRETVDQRLHYMKMEGQEVFKLAVTAMVKSCKQTLEEAGVTSEQIRWLVPHQANLRILQAVGTRLKLPSERVYVNVDRYGNTSAASIGLALDEIVRGGLIKRGEYMLLTAFGGGLTWGTVLVKW